MQKLKPLLLPVCMIGFFIGCVQIFLLLRMSWIDFSAVFFYGILFLMLYILIAAYSRRNKSLFIFAALFMIAFMCVRFSSGHIENYYFKNTIVKANILKEDLMEYRKTHKVYPESLKGLYKNSKVPKYNIGLIRFYFAYYKANTSYRIYFNHFEGKTFVSHDNSIEWNVDD